MKILIIGTFLMTSTVFATIEPSPLKYSKDVLCQLQGANAMIAKSRSLFGKKYDVLSSGLGIEYYAVLESHPLQHLYAGVVTLKNKTSQVKSEIYYDVTAGSEGTVSETNDEPIFKCDVNVLQVDQQTYELNLRR